MISILLVLFVIHVCCVTLPKCGSTVGCWCQPDGGNFRCQHHTSAKLATNLQNHGTLLRHQETTYCSVFHQSASWNPGFCTKGTVTAFCNFVNTGQAGSGTPCCRRSRCEECKNYRDCSECASDFDLINGECIRKTPAPSPNATPATTTQTTKSTTTTKTTTKTTKSPNSLPTTTISLPLPTSSIQSSSSSIQTNEFDQTTSSIISPVTTVVTNLKANSTDLPVVPTNRGNVSSISPKNDLIVIIAISIGVLCFIFIVFTIMFVFYKKNRSASTNTSDSIQLQNSDETFNPSSTLSSNNYNNNSIDRHTQRNQYEPVEVTRFDDDSAPTNAYGLSSFSNME